MADWRTWLRRLRSTLWTALALVIIGSAVLVGIGKLLLPYSERYKPRLEAVLSEQFNQPVRLDSFTGEWKAFGPRISMEGVNLLGDPGGDGAIAIQRAALDIKPLNMLFSGRPLYSFLILGADLTLTRDQNGRLELSGLGVQRRRIQTPENTDGRSGSRIRNLARLGEVRLQDSSFGFFDEQQGINLQLIGVNGRLQADGAEFGLEVSASITDADRSQVLGDLAATVLASLNDSQQLEAMEFHVETGELMLSRLAQYLPNQKVEPTSGRLNAQLWGSWSRGGAQEMAGVVDMRDAGVRVDAKDFLVTHLNSRFKWRWFDKTQWRIDLADLQIEEHGREWLAPSLTVERNLPGNLGIWVGTEYLEAEFPLELTQVIMTQFDARWPRAAPKAARGPVRDFDLIINGNRKFISTTGRFEGIDVLDWGEYPQVSGLNGHIDLAWGEGSIHVAGDSVAIHWDRNFRSPLNITLPECELEILWRNAPPGVREVEYWQVDALNCRASNPALDAIARVRVAKDDGGRPVSEINAFATRMDLPALADYWPQSFMKPAVSDWLSRSIKGGVATDVRFLLQGDGDEVPFLENQGTLLVDASIQGGVLDYSPEWPLARNINATLRIDSGRLQVAGEIGDLAGAKVETAVATIPNMRRPRLTIDYDSNANLQQLRTFLEASPLLTGSELDLTPFTLDGLSNTSGALVVPLGSVEGDLEVSGAVELQNATFTEARSQLRLEGLSGTLNYDRSGARADALQTTLDGWPADLSLQAAWGATNPFEAQLTGQFPVSLLVDRSTIVDDPLLNRLQGEALWQADLESSRPDLESPVEIQLTIRSDLEGVEMDLPPPLYKPEEDSWPIIIEFPLVSADPVLRVDLADRASLALALPEAPERSETETGTATVTSGSPTAGPDRAALNLGGGKAVLPDAGQFTLRGQTDSLDLDRWMDVITEYVRDERYGAGLSLEQARLSTNELVFLNRSYADVSMELAYEDDLLQVLFESESIAGQIRYQRNEGGTHSLSAEMERLFLGDALEESEPREADPMLYPELHLYVEHFRYMGLDMGETRIEAFPMAEGLRIDSLEAHSDNLTLQARGDWTRSDVGSRSDFDIVMTSESLGTLVEALDLSSVLEGGQTMVRFDAWWPGPPTTFGLAKLNGQMSFSVVDGTILNANPGAGRLLGLMSVGALPRRLAFDFSDVFESGFAFDQATGNIQLASGVAYTDDFALESTAALLTVVGSSDLEAQEFDYAMSVRPGVSQALPVLGALAAGPAGAAAGLALQGLFRDALGDAAEARYTITGPWAEPTVERLDDVGVEDPSEESTQNMESGNE